MKVFKKTLAVSLCALMAGTAMSGCAQATVFGNYLQDLSWSYKDSNSSMSIGEYIYYQYSAFYSASQMVENGTGDFLDQKLKDDDGKEMTAREYIEKTTDEACKNFLYVNKKFDDMGLKLTAEEITSYEASADQQWAYSKESFESYGISKESFVDAGYGNAAKLEAIFKKMYQEGGEKAVSLEEIKKYYEDNYVNYNYITVALYDTETDEDGSPKNSKKSDDDIKSIKANLDKYVKSINGGTSYSDEIKVYMKDYNIEADPTATATTILEDSGLGEELIDALNGMKDGEAKYIVVGEDGDTPTAYLLYRGDIKEQSKLLESDSNLEYSTLVTMKSEEFQDDIRKQVKDYKCEINTPAIEKYPMSAFITEPATEAATTAE